MGKKKESNVPAVKKTENLPAVRKEAHLPAVRKDNAPVVKEPPKPPEKKKSD
jgi:hypothetical protein